MPKAHSRAGFTSRVVVVTETDGMDQPGAMSRDADKITQLEARTRAYGSRKRIYLECTVSTDEEVMATHGVWVDAGYRTHVVYAFTREAGDHYLPAVGRGAGRPHRRWYNRPTRTGSLVKHLGEGYHLNHLRGEDMRGAVG